MIDSECSLRTLWRGVCAFVNSVHKMLVALVRLHISKLGSLGMFVNRLCFDWKRIWTKEDLCCHFHKVTMLSVRSSNHSGKSCNQSLDAFVVAFSLGDNSLVLSAEFSAGFRKVCST